MVIGPGTDVSVIWNIEVAVFGMPPLHMDTYYGLHIPYGGYVSVLEIQGSKHQEKLEATIHGLYPPFLWEKDQKKDPYN